MPAALLLSLILTLPSHPALDRLEADLEAGRNPLSEKLAILPVAGYPSELAYFLDSETVPVRVYYDSESQVALARLTLAAAEHSWVTEIDGFGFYAPPLTTPEGRYRLHIGDTGMGGGGYCSPIGSHAETPWDDCRTYVPRKTVWPRPYGVNYYYWHRARRRR